jgi:hypothetical protein
MIGGIICRRQDTADGRKGKTGNAIGCPGSVPIGDPQELECVRQTRQEMESKLTSVDKPDKGLKAISSRTARIGAGS